MVGRGCGGNSSAAHFVLLAHHEMSWFGRSPLVEAPPLGSCTNLLQESSSVTSPKIYSPKEPAESRETPRHKLVVYRVLFLKKTSQVCLSLLSCFTVSWWLSSPVAFYFWLIIVQTSWINWQQIFFGTHKFKDDTDLQKWYRSVLITPVI